MTAPARLRLSRAAGFDLQAFSRATNGLPAVRVVAPSRWYNPWHIQPVLGGWRCLGPKDEKIRVADEAAARQVAFSRYREWAGTWPSWQLLPLRAELGGRNLACWCPLPEEGQPDLCHAALLLDLANRPEPEEPDHGLWLFQCGECGWGGYAETEPDACPDCLSPDLIPWRRRD